MKKSFFVKNYFLLKRKNEFGLIWKQKHCTTWCINIQCVRRMTRRDYIQIVRRINGSSIDELYKVIRLTKDNMSDNRMNLINYVCNS